MGRPATGTDPTLTIRLPKDALEAIEKCVDGDAIRTRSEAARHIIMDWLRANQMLTPVTAPSGTTNGG